MRVCTDELNSVELPAGFILVIFLHKAGLLGAYFVEELNLGWTLNVNSFCKCLF